MKQYLTAEQGIGILPDGETVHTFYNPGFGLVGADWGRADILKKIRESDCLELTGPSAKAMEHGLCAYDRTAKYQGDILFIETDAKRLAQLEEELESAAIAPAVDAVEAARCKWQYADNKECVMGGRCIGANCPDWMPLPESPKEEAT